MITTELRIPANKADLLAMMWANGGNRPPVMVFHSDDGHGWLQVPRSYVKRMGIESRISGLSHEDSINLYLEEDCDLALFVETLKLPENGLMPAFWEAIPKEDVETSPVRELPRYQPALIG